jgi:ubiquinone/menaquinone biosynthesis C-methylase UbiE
MRTHWDRHAATWEQHLPATELFEKLRQEILLKASPEPGDVAADLGAGSGFLTEALIGRVRAVHAVDNSPQMLERLSQRLGANGGLVVRQCSFLAFEPDRPLDLVVSNYALHHLRNADKLSLIRKTYAQLRPGGRFVVSDIMVPLSLRPGRSKALRTKVLAMVKKGPAGFWRIAKNGLRWVTGSGEYPAEPEFWIQAFGRAGFAEVGHLSLGHETGIVWGIKPAEIVPPH